MTPRRRSKSGSRGQWMVLILLVLAGLYLYRGYRQGSRKVVYPPTAFYPVKRGDLLISIVEEGALRALNETVVRNTLEGLNRIIFLVPEGAHVKKGELVVELDSSGLKDRVSEQELAYQERLFQMLQATENLKIQKSLAESQVKDAELVLENAETDLEKYRDGEAPLLIKTVEARASVLAEQVRIARERFVRTEELFKSNNATRSEYEADSLTLKREQLALTQYQEDLRLIQKFDQPNQMRLLQSNVEQAKMDLERLKLRSANEIAQSEADLKTSKRTVELLEDNLDSLKSRLNSAKIFAPQDGLVVYAPISQYQFGGGEGRRDESRGNRGGGGEGRGGRGGGGGRTGSSVGSSASPSQRATSTASASTTTTAAGQGAANSAASGASAAGGGQRSSSGAGGSAGNSGMSGFVSYPSVRPSSTFSASAPATASAGSGSSSSVDASSSSGASSVYAVGNQSAFRSQDNFGFGSFGAVEYTSASGFLEEGAMVRQRQELIRLPDVSKMLVEVRVHESRVAQVQPGMVAYIKVENLPGRLFKGTVRRVAPLPDAQANWLNPDLKVHATDILVEDELPDLKPGVSARAEIVVTNLLKVLSVPIQTVARLNGQNVCFIRKGSGIASVPVTTGYFNDRFVEITSGLNEGDQVLLAAVGDEVVAEEPAKEEETVEAAPAPVKAAPAVEEAPAAEPRERRGRSLENGERPAGEARGNRPARRAPREEPAE